jgi:hypothetical protein
MSQSSARACRVDHLQRVRHLGASQLQMNRSMHFTSRWHSPIFLLFKCPLFINDA